MVVHSYSIRKKNSVCLGLLLLVASSGCINAGLSNVLGSLKETTAEVFHADESISLPSLDLPGKNTVKKFFALNGMMSAFTGSPKKWLPEVVMRTLRQVDSEQNVNAMAEVFTGALATNLATGKLHTNKLRSAVGAALIAVTARWVDSALRLTPWTKDLACPSGKCKGLCNECKYHKANVGLWLHGILSGAIHEIAKGPK